VLVADTKRHLVFKDSRRLGYSSEPANSLYYPNIDALFQSAARFCARDTVAVLLTGMGRDGALGLKALRNAGAMNIAQDQVSSTVYGMPKAAAETDAASEILPLDAIAPRLISIFQKGAKRI
jgi:two-component system response regulator WspF